LKEGGIKKKRKKEKKFHKKLDKEKKE